jgi:hypothetical protein
MTYCCFTRCPAVVLESKMHEIIIIITFIVVDIKQDSVVWAVSRLKLHFYTAL